MNIRRCGIVAILLAALVVATEGQKFNLGNCAATLRSVAAPTFPVNTLANVWKEYARSKAPQQHTWRCSTYTITQITSNVRYAVSVGGRKKITGTALRVAGTIDVGGSTGANTAATTFLTFTLTDGATTKSLNYYIIFADANPPTVLALYACSNLGIGRLESAILLVRDTAPDASIINGLQALAQNGFPANSLYFNYQANCLVI